jgi:hypothetical protein
MKITLDDIKDRLRRRLIEHDGNIAPHHLADIIGDARAIGLQEMDIARLVPEIDRSVNWAQVREEKRLQQASEQLQEEQKQQASELMRAMINFSFSDGVVERQELVTLFSKAAELQQDELDIARTIMSKIEALGYKPHPNADLTAGSLKEILLSTSWYEPRKYAAAKRKKPSTSKAGPVSAPVPAPVVPKIHAFGANKTTIVKGESVTIFWEVSGVEQFTISGLGVTNVLKAQKSMTPEITTTYVLRAGGLSRSVTISVEQVTVRKFWIWIIIPLLLIGFAVNRSCTGAESSSSENNESDGRAYIPATNISDEERKNIVGVLRDFYETNNKSENNSDITYLNDFFADSVKYYDDAYLQRDIVSAYVVKSNKQLSIHNSVIESIDPYARTRKNGYLVKVSGHFYSRSKHAYKTRVRPINEVIALTAQYKIISIQRQ